MRLFGFALVGWGLGMFFAGAILASLSKLEYLQNAFTEVGAWWAFFGTVIAVVGGFLIGTNSD